MVHTALQRFGTEYRQRVSRYLIAMIIIWVITYWIIRGTGQEAATLALLKGTIGKSAGNSFLSLFWHNLSASLLIIVLGLVPIPLYDLFILINAASVGLVLAIGPHPLLMFVAGILPHGIFEIPAQLISAAISARLVWFIIDKYFRHRATPLTLGTVVQQSALDTLVYVFPLLFIAGLIETYITPLLLAMTR